MIPELANWDGQTVHSLRICQFKWYIKLLDTLDLSHNTAHCQKPDDNRKNVLQSFRVFSNPAIHSDGLKKLEADVEIKNGTDAYGAEKADKNCLLFLFYLPDFPM